MVYYNYAHCTAGENEAQIDSVPCPCSQRERHYVSRSSSQQALDWSLNQWKEPRCPHFPGPDLTIGHVLEVGLVGPVLLCRWGCSKVWAGSGQESAAGVMRGKPCLGQGG